MEDKKERRKEKRTSVVGSYLYIIQNGSGGKEQKIIAMTSNISESGVCIFTFNRLSEGNSLEMRGKPVGNEPRNATVVWCREITNGFYKVGMYFQ